MHAIICVEWSVSGLDIVQRRVGRDHRRCWPVVGNGRTAQLGNNIRRLAYTTPVAAKGAVVLHAPRLIRPPVSSTYSYFDKGKRTIDRPLSGDKRLIDETAVLTMITTSGLSQWLQR